MKPDAIKNDNSFSVLPDQAGLFGLATFWSLFFLSGQKSLLCADTMWHLRVGQEILERGHILTDFAIEIVGCE